MSDGLVRLLDGNTFVVSEENGDIDASPTIPTGLFSFDTRFLSKWTLSINGERVSPLSAEEVEYFEARFFVVATVPTPLVDTRVSAIRERSIGESFTERLTVINHEAEAIDLQVRIDVESDFADLFEIKDVRNKKRQLLHPDRRRVPTPRLSTGDVPPGDPGLLHRAGPGRRAGTDLRRPARTARPVGHRSAGASTGRGRT